MERDMGKRSDFERKPRDFYPTPYEAVMPLIPHLWEGSNFNEPCAGDGALVKHLESIGLKCFFASDIEPRGEGIMQIDALKFKNDSCKIITNPPWDRKILHPMIEHFRTLNKAWLLIDADWMHTKQSSEYMKYCSRVVSVGRVKWIPDSKMTGKDNCAWFCFEEYPTSTCFFGR